jgi:indolepyruvate ferredoxin oxidoreductase
MLLPKLDAKTLSAAVALASVPEEIRGYGHVKEATLESARRKQSELLETFSASVTGIGAARAA